MGVWENFRAHLRLVVGLYVLVVSVSSFAGSPGGDSNNVFGTDKRQAVTSTKYPWKVVGRLGMGCTGTLVAPDLVLTAAHCVIDKDTKKLREYLGDFSPNMIAGTSVHASSISYVWWGTSDPDSFRASDWAILRLSKRLGDTYGWMGVSHHDGFSSVTAVGYSADFREGYTASAHIGCNFRGQKNGFLLHDCHNTRGASGGPIFVMQDGKPFIVAINVAEYRNGGEVSLHPSEYSESYANIAVPSSTFLAKLKEAKNQ